jgi:hypothetical protein
MTRVLKRSDNVIKVCYPFLVSNVNIIEEGRDLHDHIIRMVTFIMIMILYSSYKF